MPIKEIAHAYRPTRHASPRSRARPHSAPRGPLRPGSAEPGRPAELSVRLGLIPAGQRRRLGDGDRQLSAHDGRSPLDRRGRARRDHHRLERDPPRAPKRLRVPGARRPHDAGPAVPGGARSAAPPPRRRRSVRDRHAQWRGLPAPPGLLPRGCGLDRRHHDRDRASRRGRGHGERLGLLRARRRRGGRGRHRFAELRHPRRAAARRLGRLGCRPRPPVGRRPLGALCVARGDRPRGPDDYGDWRETGPYGAVWVPRSMIVGWAPYRYGHWAWVDPWGWTWIDDAPWGFAPFHYGRWVYVDDGWAWVPGHVVARPVYAPALVVFVGGRNWSVAIGLGGGGGGGGGGVAWFPLGPEEPYVPGYHVSNTYIRNVNVTNVNVTNINVTNVNVTNINYRNRNAPGAVTVVTQPTFLDSRPVGRRVLVGPRERRDEAAVVGGGARVP